LDQPRGHGVVAHIGCRGRQRDQDAGGGDHHMQLPPVDPAVPTRFGSAGLGIDAGVRHFPAFFVLSLDCLR
jgi:hypothetical protein